MSANKRLKPTSRPHLVANTRVRNRGGGGGPSDLLTPSEFLVCGVVRDVSARHIPERRTNENVAGEMFLRRVSREAHASRQRVRSPLYPRIVRITMRDRRCKRKARRRVTGRERPSTAPEFAGAVRRVRELAIERQLQSEVYDARRTKRSKRRERSFAEFGVMTNAAGRPPERARSDLHPESDVGPFARCALQRLRLNPVCRWTIDFRDQDSRRRTDRQLPR